MSSNNLLPISSPESAIFKKYNAQLEAGIGKKELGRRLEEDGFEPQSFFAVVKANSKAGQPGHGYLARKTSMYRAKKTVIGTLKRIKGKNKKKSRNEITGGKAGLETMSAQDIVPPPPPPPPPPKGFPVAPSSQPALTSPVQTNRPLSEEEKQGEIAADSDSENDGDYEDDSDHELPLDFDKLFLNNGMPPRVPSAKPILPNVGSSARAPGRSPNVGKPPAVAPDNLSILNDSDNDSSDDDISHGVVAAESVASYTSEEASVKSAASYTSEEPSMKFDKVLPKLQMPPKFPSSKPNPPMNQNRGQDDLSDGESVNENEDYSMNFINLPMMAGVPRVPSSKPVLAADEARNMTSIAIRRPVPPPVIENDSEFDSESEFTEDEEIVLPNMTFLPRVPSSKPVLPNAAPIAISSKSVAKKSSFITDSRKKKNPYKKMLNQTRTKPNKLNGAQKAPKNYKPVPGLSPPSPFPSFENIAKTENSAAEKEKESESNGVGATSRDMIVLSSNPKPEPVKAKKEPSGSELEASGRAGVPSILLSATTMAKKKKKTEMKPMLRKKSSAKPILLHQLETGGIKKYSSQNNLKKMRTNSENEEVMSNVSV